MSPTTRFLNRLSVCAATLFFAQHAFAAVRILEGSAQPSPSPPPVASTPGGNAPQYDPPEPPPSAVLPPASSGDSAILNPLTGPAATAMPAPALASSPPIAPTDLATVKVANPAEVSIEMMPGTTVSIGSRVSFRVTSKQGGYLVLVDIDATGHLTQIYPNTASLTRTNRPNANYIKPGGTLTIPLSTDPSAPIQYVVSPPNGRAMIVAILSAQPVQLLDLPEAPPDMKGSSEMLVFLSNWTNQLRVSSESSQLREAKWSFDAKAYTIQ